MSNNTINTNSSLKEYYIKMQEMMNTAVNMVTAINQSLTTATSEITLATTVDGVTTTFRVPSFLYLESKIEQLETNFNALFNMPRSGEAWFQKSADMFKLQMVKSTSAPTPPVISTDNIGFNVTENTFLKDLVNPKTYIRLNVKNLADNIDTMFMRKIVIFNTELVSFVQDLKTYDEYVAALFNAVRGKDYEIYDSDLKLPIKKDTFKSEFKIEEIPELESGNPWTDTTQSPRLLYQLRLNTLKYTDQEDSSIELSLKAGDLVCLRGQYAVYKVRHVQTIHNMDNTDDLNDHIVVLEEYIGHITLQTTEENSEMVLELYNENYDKYHYVDVPLEENPYIAVFLGTIQNNIRSILSDAVFFDLNNVYMRDENGNLITDGNGNYVSYMEYYNRYCRNIGDMILGFTQTAYPQVSNYNVDQLYELTSGIAIKNLVTSSMYHDDETVLTVNKINNHLIDDVTSENILSLHEQKSEINSQLNSVQTNIDNVYNQLTTTDFSQEVTVTQESLRSQLNTYYQERLALQKQAIAIIDNINLLKGDVKGVDKSKYRIRGVAEAGDKNDSDIESTIVQYLHEQYGDKCELIGIDVEYKYKSINKDTTTVESHANAVFSDWNKMPSIDKQRYLEFDNNSFTVKFVKYNSANNIIKWNQIDIPINQGEDVVLRVRYKYNIGQPFMNLYTPWSDEITISFPIEMIETTEIATVIADNDNDTISAKFSKTLINEGYQEHIANMLIDNSQTFYHMPENIYSGFNTPENKLISLKDKLTSMSTDINDYKALIDNEINADYKVYLEWDNNSIQLSNDTENNILINEIVNGANDSFIKKKMNIVIKNTGSIPIRMYSIFPGNKDIPLLLTDMEFYNKMVVNYERVPILKSGASTPSEGILAQTLGQWIYFRQNNPYTREDFYLNTESQRTLDINSAMNNERQTYMGESEAVAFANAPTYIAKDRNQALLGYRNRIQTNNVLNINTNIDATKAIEVTNNSINTKELLTELLNYIKLNSAATIDYTTYNNINNYIYDNVLVDKESNLYILKYEHIHGQKENEPVYMSEKQSIKTFMNYAFDHNWGFEKNIESFNGAFLIPEIVSESEITCDMMGKNQYRVLEVGKSLSIPIIFEYFLDGEKLSSIMKTLAFDLRTSILQEPEHYILNVKAMYDYSQTNADLANNISLLDNLTE